MSRPDTLYKVTGVLTNGRRFRAIHTNDSFHAFGINLFRGNVWKRINGKWTRVKSVWN